MPDTVLIYRATPRFMPGEELPRVVVDGRGRKFVFPMRRHVEQIASRRAEDGGTEYLVKVSEPQSCR
jgi:hypothetical protein